MAISDVLISVSAILVIVETGYAIKCYSCSSIMDNRCSEEFQLTEVSAQDCNGSCVTYRSLRTTYIGNIMDITRACAEKTTDTCFSTKNRGSDVTGCTCNSDYCNGDMRMTVSVFVVVMSSLILIIDSQPLCIT